MAARTGRETTTSAAEVARLRTYRLSWPWNTLLVQYGCVSQGDQARSTSETMRLQLATKGMHSLCQPLRSTGKSNLGCTAPVCAVLSAKNSEQA